MIDKDTVWLIPSTYTLGDAVKVTPENAHEYEHILGKAICDELAKHKGKKQDFGYYKIIGVSTSRGELE